MSLFRSAIVAISVALTSSLGSASATTTSTLPPNLANSHTLDLRAAGSQMVVDTIENALRRGGFALFDERFQLDSSLSWVFGEAIEGEVDAVIPLWGKGKRAVFLQPGAVFWTGLEEAERIDGNLGVVYRAEMAEGVVGGASIFYDHDFEIGHQRIGVGVDAQRGGFYGAFNYYHPVSDTEDGREGYVEDALRGMDASLAVESAVTRLGGNVGYWKFQGEDDARDEWEFSYGLDAGLRIVPGVFLEGSLQRHDKKASLGQRASVGLAFRFSLPGLEGKSYGDGGRVLSLHKPVGREKRVLYEEREAVPKANLIASGTGNTRNVAVRLDESFAEEVVLNLVGSGSATYGTDGDWTMSVGGEECTAVTGTSCQVTIAAGETVAGDEVVITFQDPDRGEPAENIVLSVEIASTGVELAPGNPLVVRIPEGEPLPNVSLSASSTEIAEGGMATLTLTLSEMLDADTTFNLIGVGRTAEVTYGTDGDWNLSVGGTGCDDATESSPCQVTISQGVTTAEVTVEVNTDTNNETTPETFTVSVEVDSGSADIVQAGSPSSLNFTIPAESPPPTVSLNYSGGATVQEGDTVTMTIALSEALGENVSFNFSLGNDNEADYGISGDFVIRYNGTSNECSSITECTPVPPTINMGDTSIDISISILPDTQVHTDTDAELVSLSFGIADAGMTGLILGSTVNQTFTIAASR